MAPVPDARCPPTAAWCGGAPSTPPRSSKRQKPSPKSPRPSPRSPRPSTPRSARSQPNTPSSSDDRFIPNRGRMDFDDANYQLNSEDAPRSDRQGRSAAPVDVEFRRAMRSALLPHAGEAGNADAVSSSSSKIFRFGRSPNAAQSPGFDESRFRSALEVIADLNADDGASQRCSALARPVPTKPSRILDAPDIVDDYYLNLLSWSSTNILAVALANNVYLWNASTNEVSELLQLDVGDVVTSVAWAPGGTHLCVGTDSASVQLWDASRTTLVRSMHGHSARVGALAWNPQSRCLNSGSRDALILQHDARAQRHRTATLVGHQQEVCGLSWAADGGTLASGGNENYLCLWDAARSGAARGPEVSPRCVLRQHQAAVKALSWCPSHRNLLASGGGTADRSIKFWNAHTGALLNSVDTGSQVCALLWSRHHKELVSSHGFSQNQLCLWRYPSMQKVCELTGHTARVLHLAQSPDGRTVVSAAADETLRFWSVFGGPSENRKAAVQHLGAVGAGLAIR